MDILHAIREFLPEIQERSLEIERARSVPPELVRKLGRGGAFRLYVPRSLGGGEVDPMTACQLVEEVSRADGSTGWTTMILNSTFFTAWLEPAVAREILETDSELGVAGLFAPVGRAEPSGDGTLRLSGRWPFNSGSPHASWFCEGALVDRKAEPPAWRFLFLPASDVEILDTWHAAGLRGTASHDVVVEGARIPLERTTNPIFEKAAHDTPLYRFSFFALLASMISGFPLGVARRSLDEFEALATRKGREGGKILASEQVVQLEVARCEAELRSARSWMLDVLAGAWDTAVAGDELSRDQKSEIRLACFQTMWAGLDVVDRTFGLAGGGALYESSPLQRCWRDMHAASAHIFFSNNNAALLAQAQLGQPIEEYLL